MNFLHAHVHVLDGFPTCTCADEFRLRARVLQYTGNAAERAATLRRGGLSQSGDGGGAGAATLEQMLINSICT